MAEASYIPRLKTLYEDVIRENLVKEFNYKNSMEIPRIEKVVINMGVGEAVNDTKKVKAAFGDLALIAGQQPVVTRARKSIAGFKVREDMPLGCKVTLRSTCLLYTSPSPRDLSTSRMPSSA